ncbi:MAG TPA: nucleoside recognition domain-containing protein, partial [Lachnospiraceae bacterium]|nr:nucleoside recognition domain-containing protein [Lachnospiraceae bacterium]
IITNNFMPCNGRFPTLIALLTMFFVSSQSGLYGAFCCACLLTLLIALGILMTFMTSKVLSCTLLKGIPSAFVLELPPYRKPQIGKIILHSLMDRTLFVLGRAVVVAAPAGLLIWIMANITVNQQTLLSCCSDFLDPFGQLLGMDGVILLAFILGFPANEIVLPIIIMTYLGRNSILEMNSILELKQLLVEKCLPGWFPPLWQSLCYNCRRHFAVMVSAPSIISMGVPVKTTSPPFLPPSGPISIR